MPHFTHPDWRDILAANGLNQFSALWTRRAEWFEPPNQRRGGWSGVSRIDLRAVAGREIHAFLKRQQNHIFKTLRHPIRGESTLTREFNNILLLHRLGIPTLEPLFFGAQDEKKQCRAILLTLALEDYRPLSELDPRALTRTQRCRLLQVAAETTREMHRHKLQHCCFYPKHIFVRQNGDDFSISLIDLEKLKRRLFAKTAVVRDLDTFNRHAEGWSRTDRLRFFLAYRQEKRIGKQSKRLLRHIMRRRKQKQK